ncbi:hypothetical protein GE061_011965 [Apolygus lucorum]|uniref:Endonuclease-reverse transcriptase n=1 Tax=Apolygus lucorum TaxID=248454 RepID=A0A8S9XR83_APOLU|nr:hypothetical protein GE061_011965 [Apolygus lucorum]
MKKTRWWSVEVQEAVQVKKAAWKVYLEARTHETYGLYKIARQEVKRLVKEAKKKAWEEYALQHNLNIWDEELRKRGLRINPAKTKSMVIAREEIKHQNLRVGGELVEQVAEFKYLGATMSQSGKIKNELNARIAAGSRLFYALNRKFLSKDECRSWALTKKEYDRLQASEMKYLRKVAKKTRWDRVRNTTIRTGLKVRPMDHVIKDAQLRWLGHVVRMPNNRYPKRAHEARPEGTRPRGRRRITWRENVQEAAKERGVRRDRIEEACLDRTRWRRVLSILYTLWR